MKNRDRITGNVLGRKIDRLPLFISIGPWRETMCRWLDEGLADNEEWKRVFGVEGETAWNPELLDIVRRDCSKWNKWFGFDEGFSVIQEVPLGFEPAFKEEILEEQGNSRIMRDSLGATIQTFIGSMSIPRYIDYPVKNRSDWEKLKEERLQLNNPARFPDNWDVLVENYNTSDEAVQIGKHPYGLFGTLRELMGVEEFLVSFYTQPELIKDMMDHFTDLWLEIYERVSQKVHIDMIHMWEDMSGCHGSLLSPEHTEQFMMPNYRKIAEFAKSKGIEIFSVDTDGNVSQLLPVFIGAGVNLVWPFEVKAGSDIVAYGKQYPELAIMGGIEKGALALGKEAIDAELKRIEPMFRRGRYFPALDHGIPPDVSLDNMNYYVERIKELTYKA